MHFSTLTLAALAAAAVATPALAQTDTTPAQDNSPPTQAASQTAASADTAPPKAFTLTSAITFTSDYRFRGLTQSDGAAAQGTVNINSAIGFYIGTWASTIDGSGRVPLLTGYGKEEVDLYGGFTKTFKHGLGVDIGLLYYYYPGGAKGQNTDFFEPYASVSYTLGPIAAKAGVAYAWGNQDGLDFRPNNSDDNIYVYGEASLAIPTTPVTLKGHFGSTKGSLGLANLNSNDDSYLDWSVTAEAVGGPLKVGVSYVDTDITEARGTFSRGSYAPRRTSNYADFYGRGATVIGYVGLSF